MAKRKSNSQYQEGNRYLYNDEIIEVVATPTNTAKRVKVKQVYKNGKFGDPRFETKENLSYAELIPENKKSVESESSKSEKKATVKKVVVKKRTIPAKKSVFKKKELTWQEEALLALKKETNNDDLEIEREEGEDEFWVGDGSEEYRVFKTWDDARHTAEEEVEDMIDNEPELFNKDFMQNHVYVSDIDKRIIAGEEADRRMEDEGLTDEDENYSEEYDKVYDEWYEGLDNDPVGFLVDQQGIYSDISEISFIQIDSKEAAKAAVNEDGVAHFLAGYDHEEMELGNGFYAYRHN